MAYTTHSPAVSKRISITSPLRAIGRAAMGVFDTLNRAMVLNSTAQQRLQKIEQLNRLSDAELAQRGLKREDITHHVFRDLFWT